MPIQLEETLGYLRYAATKQYELKSCCVSRLFVCNFFN